LLTVFLDWGIFSYEFYILILFIGVWFILRLWLAELSRDDYLMGVNAIYDLISSLFRLLLDTDNYRITGDLGPEPSLVPETEISPSNESSSSTSYFYCKNFILLPLYLALVDFFPGVLAPELIKVDKFLVWFLT